MLLVDAALGDHFNAGRGSQVDIVNGGSIGENFEAVGATVNIAGGSVGEGFQAFRNSVVEVSGGTLSSIEAESSANITISGGVVGSFQGNANMSGGVVSLFEQLPGTTNITGGVVENFTISPLYSYARVPGVLNISGGDVGISLADVANFIGTEFFIDGQPIAGLTPNIPLEIDAASGLFSGTLADRTQFSYDLINQDRPTAGRRFRTLTVTLVPEPTTLTLLGLSGLPALRRFRRRCPFNP